ncbi:hypothetical protein [uncultured Megasphaera sp.]|uniref:hypothetical protein n=1 Tax=uncultured Megasphaera sp. TaxID=165188 RepID=UPI002659D095|nr:hypothetical protein [uncultured Megasphaera sp.]
MKKAIAFLDVLGFSNHVYEDLEETEKILHDINELIDVTALYNFYAASEVDKTSLHKACTKSVGFFADCALETKVPKNISRYVCQFI